MNDLDPLPWAQIPHWVMLSDVSREAKLIYVLLVMHVDRTDLANRRAWPSQKRLAKMAGFSNPDSVGVRIRELEAAGILTVERGRHPRQQLRKRNTYHVLLAADPVPDSHHGALSAWAVLGDDDDFPGDTPSGVSGSVPNAGRVPETHPAGSTQTHPAGSGETPVDGSEVDLREEEQPEEEQLLPAKREVDDPTPASEDPPPVEPKPAKPRRTTTEKSCGYPGCLGGSVLVSTTVDPLGIIRCPGCWLTEDKAA